MPSLIIRIYGIVQGVGFRPFVARQAEKCSILGNVSNKGSYVEINAQGEKAQLDKFLECLKEIPERAVVLETDIAEAEPTHFTSFDIIESAKETGNIFVSPDIATCDKCRAELFDKSDRRFLHPFINCTNCGPRLTILKAMPYDRERTTMSDFHMCPQCEYEYTHAQTRRYDAQPVCCNDCGPEVWIYGTDMKNHTAITYARKSIMDGKIIAVKGIGGFHLCCDATNEQAVKRLRMLKNRPAKPFAVMMKDFSVVQRECKILEGQEEYINGYQKPILLLEKKADGKLSDSISPDNPSVGVILPYAPLQMLLFDYNDEVHMTDCLVMTSGNVSGAPICRDSEEAEREIGSFCDIILTHNRQILLRADDSVMDWYEGKPYMIRRSRGFSPLPVMLNKKLSGTVLAIGGELKNTFCIGKNDLLYLSPYVGDMADIRTVNALRESVNRMENLLEAKPDVVVCDMHPKYNTVLVAEEMGLPVIKIQHHYAHILSCMAENNCFEKVIGLSFDGTGYGTDKTIWGGEILLCDYNGFERLGSVKPFSQVGGDLSSKEGWRIAASYLHKLFGDEAVSIAQKLDLCDEKNLAVISKMSDMKINTVMSTSLGRIFDGISAVLGIRKTSTFEGESSMTLEFTAEAFEAHNPSYVPAFVPDIYEASERMYLDTDELFRYICLEKCKGVDSRKLAYDFHYALAEMSVMCCKKIREKTSLNVCALSGGVFQNKLLLKMTKNKLEASGFKVLSHSLVPANDGGIALGQAAAALYRKNN